MTTKRPKRPVRTGVLLIDKPKGMSSHDAVKLVRRAYGQREVGHTGTLDPMATGLMVVMLGRATKIARFVEAADKAYDGTVVLGRSTTTYDAEGDTVEEASSEKVQAVTQAQLQEALQGLTGAVEQEVPAFSAVKVDGERLYAKARRGEAVERPRRIIQVHALSATRFALPEVDIQTRVSKGTYIRTLAVQIGEALGLPAHLSMLRRTHVGRFSVENAERADALTGEDQALMPMADALAHLERFHLDEGALLDVQHGRPLKARQLAGQLEALTKRAQQVSPEEPVALLDPQGALVAVAHLASPAQALLKGPPSGRALRYACVLVSPAPSRAAQ